MGINLSSPGIARKTGIAAGPAATVTRASGWRSIRYDNIPVDKTASPTRVDVMNRMRICDGFECPQARVIRGGEGLAKALSGLAQTGLAV